MTAQDGAAFLLQVGDGGGPEVFTTVAALRQAELAIENEIVEVTNQGSGGMREPLGGGGIQSVSLSGSGLFTDAAAEETLRANAASRSIDNYRIVAGNGDVWQGAFLIARYQRSGKVDGEEAFAIALESSGAVAFTPGS